MEKQKDHIEIQTPYGPFIITEEIKALVEEEYRKFDADPRYGLAWEEVKHRLFME